MTDPATVMGGSGTAVAAYEELRSCVLAGSGTCDCDRGQIFLLREGIVAWIARGAACAAPTNPTTDRQSDATAPVLGGELHASMVRVLASMALAAGRREMTT